MAAETNSTAGRAYRARCVRRTTADVSTKHAQTSARIVARSTMVAGSRSTAVRAAPIRLARIISAAVSPRRVQNLAKIVVPLPMAAVGRSTAVRAVPIRHAPTTSAAHPARRRPAPRKAKTVALLPMAAAGRSTAEHARARIPVRATFVSVIQLRVRHLVTIAVHTVTAVAERSIAVPAVPGSRAVAADASHRICLIRRVKALRGFSRISAIPIRSSVMRVPVSP